MLSLRFGPAPRHRIIPRSISPLLSNSNVDARKGLGLGLLVNNGVKGNGGLSSLPVSDDELALSAPDGDQGVDGLEAGEHGLRDGFAGDDAWGLDLRTGALAGVEGGSAVDGLPDAVDDASEELGSDGDVDDGSGPLDSVPLEDVTIVAENHNSYVGLFEGEGHAAETAGEDDHFSGLDLLESVDAGDSVSYGDDLSHLCILCGSVESLGGGNLVGKVVGELNDLGGHGPRGGGTGGSLRLEWAREEGGE